MDTLPANAPKSFPQLRIVVAVFVVLFALLAAIYFVAFRKEYAVLYQDLRTPEAAAIVTELEAQGVAYRLGAGGTQILVPATEADSVRVAIAGSDLPVKGLDGFELFDDSDMGLTEFAQKIRYQRALQGELARTILAMEGVEEARVHISMPERALFRGERREPKAAVTLSTRSPEFELPARIEGVQRLVAAAVTDLAASDVVVLNARGEVISPRADVIADADNGLIETLVRRALPDIRFALSLEHTPMPTPTPDATVAPDGSATPQATIAIVCIVTESELTPEEQARVRVALREASIENVAFQVGLPAPGVNSPHIATPEAPSPLRRGDIDEVAPPDLPLMLPISIGLGVLLFIGAAFWIRSRSSRPMLTIEDHRRFADRLRAALQSGQQQEARGDA